MAWVASECRFCLGMPVWAVFSQSRLPSRLFRQITFQVQGSSPSTMPRPQVGSVSNFGLADALTAVVMKTQSFQRMGEEIASPSIAVVHTTLLPDLTSHAVGGSPAPTPEPLGPRNEGQFSPRTAQEHS